MYGAWRDRSRRSPVGGSPGTVSPCPGCAPRHDSGSPVHNRERCRFHPADRSSIPCLTRGSIAYRMPCWPAAGCGRSSVHRAKRGRCALPTRCEHRTGTTDAVLANAADAHRLYPRMLPAPPRSPGGQPTARCSTTTASALGRDPAWKGLASAIPRTGKYASQPWATTSRTIDLGTATRPRFAGWNVFDVRHPRRRYLGGGVPPVRPIRTEIR